MAIFNRAPRLNLSFPVELRTRRGSLQGSCRNVSASGMLAVFSAEPELWTEVELWLRHGDDPYSVRSWVARVHGPEAGLSFVMRTDEDRRAISRILRFALDRTHPLGLAAV